MFSLHFPYTSFMACYFFLQDASQVSIGEIKPTDGSCSLQLKRPSKSRTPPGFWNFLERYGFRYGDGHLRTLLPCEVWFLLPAYVSPCSYHIFGSLIDFYCPVMWVEGFVCSQFTLISMMFQLVTKFDVFYHVRISNLTHQGTCKCPR